MFFPQSNTVNSVLKDQNKQTCKALLQNVWNLTFLVLQLPGRDAVALLWPCDNTRASATWARAKCLKGYWTTIKSHHPSPPPLLPTHHSVWCFWHLVFKAIPADSHLAELEGQESCGDKRDMGRRRPFLGTRATCLFPTENSVSWSKERCGWWG